MAKKKKKKDKNKNKFEYSNEIVGVIIILLGIIGILGTGIIGKFLYIFSRNYLFGFINIFSNSRINVNF